MWTSVLSTNPVESDEAWEAYQRWVNSKSSKLKNFGHKVSERNFRSRFEPTTEALQLQRTSLCLPGPKIEEEAKETEEAFGNLQIVMQDVTAQLDKGKQVASKDQEKAQDSDQE